MLNCEVCGSQSLSIDEVVYRERMLLVECLHCEHRWTRVLSFKSEPLNCSDCPGEAIFLPAQPEVASAA